MTPRTEVLYLCIDDPMDEILATMKRCPFTRLPLCRESIDDVIGMVHVKDLVKVLDLSPRRASRSGESEAMPTGEGELHVIGQGVIHLDAIKRDVVSPGTYECSGGASAVSGGAPAPGRHRGRIRSTMGIVTLEDVIEEMVGDIRDEFDLFAGDMMKKRATPTASAGVFRCTMAHHIPNLSIDHTEEDVDTAGGYVSQVLGRLPATGEKFEVGPYTWTVTSADVRRVRDPAGAASGREGVGGRFEFRRLTRWRGQTGRHCRNSVSTPRLSPWSGEIAFQDVHTRCFMLSSSSGDGDGERFSGGFFGMGKIAFAVAQVAEAGLQVEGYRVVDIAAHLVLQQVILRPVPSAGDADNVLIVDVMSRPQTVTGRPISGRVKWAS